MIILSLAFLKIFLKLTQLCLPQILIGNLPKTLHRYHYLFYNCLSVYRCQQLLKFCFFKPFPLSVDCWERTNHNEIAVSLGLSALLIEYYIGTNHFINMNEA